MEGVGILQWFLALIPPTSWELHCSGPVDAKLHLGSLTAMARVSLSITELGGVGSFTAAVRQACNPGDAGGNSATLSFTAFLTNITVCTRTHIPCACSVKHVPEPQFAAIQHSREWHDASSFPIDTPILGGHPGNAWRQACNPALCGGRSDSPYQGWMDWTLGQMRGFDL
eukprot:751947-Pelagomonas_calceolata.AAC.1